MMERRGRSLNFSVEETEDLADMGHTDSRLFALLTLLFPFVDARNILHVDHVFPASRFSQARLLREEISIDRFDEYRDCANRLGNLQLLDGDVNNEKRAKLPSEWLMKHFEYETTRRHYCEQHVLGELPEDVHSFMEFYEARRERASRSHW